MISILFFLTKINGCFPAKNVEKFLVNADFLQTFLQITPYPLEFELCHNLSLSFNGENKKKKLSES